ncbi:hemin uptake protein HemP [Parasulfuritortus cantonensis]|uniref:Hemin uptake protein HemP n=2 Tax=Parasulfuritortus cantonensis TaxID=2528202 RepID=A0A4R1BEK0_9PROT|nr:hemin uptake protein HemP [Parasulfuritortus cantonensis]
MTHDATPDVPPEPLQHDGVIQAEALFQGRRVLIIEFRGEHYQLRQTRSGKLILTK